MPLSGPWWVSFALQVDILTIPVIGPIFKAAPLPIAYWELMVAMAFDWRKTASFRLRHDQYVNGSFSGKFLIPPLVFEPESISLMGFIPVAIAHMTATASMSTSSVMAQHDCPTPLHARTQDTDGRHLRRYQRRWLVERFFAWLQWKRWLLIRWEYYASSFLGFVQLAGITMLLKQL